MATTVGAQPACDLSDLPLCDGWCSAPGEACADIGGACGCTTGFFDCPLGTTPNCYGICGTGQACFDVGGACGCMGPTTTAVPATTTTTSFTTTTSTTTTTIGGIDHFQCYKAKDLRSPRFEQIENVLLVDQFGGSTADVKKPFLVCAPADKNGSGVTNPATHQCCYKIKGTKLDPAVGVAIGDQFGSLQLELKKAKILCQPCSKAVLP